MKLIPIFLTIGTLSFGQTSENKKVGAKIEGSFLGNGKKITATAIKTKEAIGNPIEDGTPAEYEIRFSDKNLKPIKAGCCEITLINEGDLNNDGKDDISIYQAPMNGCTYTMQTYSESGGKWKQIVKPFLIATGCSEWSNKELQSRIFLEHKNIYFLEKDMSNENGKWIRRKVKKK